MDALLNRKVVVNELNMHCEFWQICKGVEVVNKKEVMQWIYDHMEFDECYSEWHTEQIILFKKAIEQTKDSEVII